MYTNVGFEKIFSDVNLLKTLILLVRTTLLNRLYVAKYVTYVQQQAKLITIFGSDYQ